LRQVIEMKEALSDTNVTLNLSLIQRRCSELMEGLEELELSLEDTEVSEGDSRDPYNSNP